MILVVGFVAVIVVVMLLMYLSLKKKTFAIDTMRDAMNKYQTSTQDEISTMHNEKATFNLLLAQKEQTLDQSLESSSQRISELKEELQTEKQKSDGYRIKNENYSSEVSKLNTQITEQSKNNQEKLELIKNNEDKLKI